MHVCVCMCVCVCVLVCVCACVYVFDTLIWGLTLTFKLRPANNILSQLITMAFLCNGSEVSVKL